MPNNQITTRIIICGDTTANWGNSTKVLLKNEFGIELTSGIPKIKIGDGVNTFASLPYATLTPEEIHALVDKAASSVHTHSNKSVLDAIQVALTDTLKKNYDTAYSHSQLPHAPADAQANQNTFSNVKIGESIISANTISDTLELIAGTNVAVTSDVAKSKITITAKDTTYGVASDTVSGLMSATEHAKLTGIESGAEMNSIHGIKGEAESIYRTGNVDITKGNIGLGNIDNTSDANKPISQAAQSALDLKANLASPILSGVPTAPTATSSTNSTQVATTEFVKTAINNVLSASEAMTYKGTIGIGGTVSDLPASHNVGDTYKIITAGIYAENKCEIGDMIICVVTGTINAVSDWSVVQSNIDGAVISSATSVVTGTVPIFDGTTGKTIKTSGFTIGISVPSDAKFTDTVYTHPDTTASNTASAQTATHGGIITVVDSITRNSTGHVTGVNTKEVTLPNTFSTDNLIQGNSTLILIGGSSSS